MASAPYCESRVLDEIVHVRDTTEIEIVWNGVKIAIPDDLSVIGFDHSPVAFPGRCPALPEAWAEPVSWIVPHLAHHWPKRAYKL